MIPDVLPRPSSAASGREPGTRVDADAFDAALTAAVGTPPPEFRSPDTTMPPGSETGTREAADAAADAPVEEETRVQVADTEVETDADASVSTDSPGEAGTPRDTGTPGDTGSPGDAGAPGDAGTRGETGTPGDAGTPGQTGTPGDAGTETATVEEDVDGAERDDDAVRRPGGGLAGAGPHRTAAESVRSEAATTHVPTNAADHRARAETATTDQAGQLRGDPARSGERPAVPGHQDPAAPGATPAGRTAATQEAAPADHGGGDGAASEGSGPATGRGPAAEPVPSMDGAEPVSEDGEGPGRGPAVDPAPIAADNSATPGDVPDDVVAAASRRGESPAPPATEPRSRDNGPSVPASPAAPTTASAPSSPTPPTAANAAPPPAPPQPPPPVAQQLVGHVSPLLGGADGGHELTIELAPAELGRVRLEITLEDGLLHVRVHADDPMSRRLLAESMGELRAALTEAGVRAGDLDVGDDAPPRAGDDGPGPDHHPGRGRGRLDDPAPAAGPTRTIVAGRSAIDVLL